MITVLFFLDFIGYLCTKIINKEQTPSYESHTTVTADTYRIKITEKWGVQGPLVGTLMLLYKYSILPIFSLNKT